MAIPAILRQLGKNAVSSSLSPMMNKVKASLSQIAEQNPEFADEIQLAATNPKEAFYRMAQKKGVNANDVLNDVLKQFR